MYEKLSDDDLLAPERCRVNAYKLLAECFHEPDEELAGLLTEVTADEGSDRDGGLELDIPADELNEAMTDLESLRVDYARLFVGPFEVLAPPYESTYVDDPDRVMTESTVEVTNEYRQEQVDIGLDEPADHVAAELEFVYLLARHEVEALAAGEYETAADYLRRQHEFLGTHLGRWIGEFADDVRSHADTEFYRRLADETERFVERDGRRLADRLDRLGIQYGEGDDDGDDDIDTGDLERADLVAALHGGDDDGR
ncbi:TorD/DmsD family molecular chaperone [Halobiforma nitratireducens]|uniref:Cytoplasmic chaperone TorD family protein n=1 Tax=Halobiforma nitratireducens JCM 10879 TaxID=1227454 RepID=M0MQ62_9EURY|nr:molecular chaperone TorD family protein [Halobiforma nitratireducens]EMA46595.1 cytoplasmic chaperone TorD family protein [Halobiforma nitratireducens JCM 10879]